MKSMDGVFDCRDIMTTLFFTGKSFMKKYKTFKAAVPSLIIACIFSLRS